MSSFPTAIERTEDGGLRIHWSDETVRRYGLHELRDACPCATCREKRRQPEEKPQPQNLLPVLSAAEARPLAITDMRPVGNYAYNIAYSDGHDTGIYPLELLSELGKLEE